MGAASNIQLCLSVSRQRRDGTYVALIGPDAFSCDRLFERFTDPSDVLNSDAPSFVMTLAGKLFPAAIGETPAQTLAALDDRLSAVRKRRVTTWITAVDDAFDAITTCPLSPYRTLADTATDGRIPRVDQLDDEPAERGPEASAGTWRRRRFVHANATEAIKENR